MDHDMAIFINIILFGAEYGVFLSRFFEELEYKFGTILGKMANTGCVWVDQEDANSISVNMGCGFPGTSFADTRGDNSRITINCNSTLGWAPHTVNILSGEVVLVLERDRVVPQVKPNEVAIVVAPVGADGNRPVLSVGPNPLERSAGPIRFFRQGGSIASARLAVYDVAGNLVSKISIKDKKTIGTTARRQVGAWDLRDRRGRLIASGTYLLRGTVKTVGGERERVSVVLGVR
jgi:hypothetical protein